MSDTRTYLTRIDNTPDTCHGGDILIQSEETFLGKNISFPIFSVPNFSPLNRARAPPQDWRHEHLQEAREAQQLGGGRPPPHLHPQKLHLRPGSVLSGVRYHLKVGLIEEEVGKDMFLHFTFIPPCSNMSNYIKSQSKSIYFTKIIIFRIV